MVTTSIRSTKRRAGVGTEGVQEYGREYMSTRVREVGSNACVSTLERVRGVRGVCGVRVMRSVCDAHGSRAFTWVLVVRCRLW